MQLIDRSLVMIAKRRIDGRGAKSCVVHDLLRDLCLKKSKEESFLKYWKSDYLQNIYEEGHRIRAFGETTTLSYCQHVRSYVGDRQSSSFYVRDMRLLRVLHFKNIYSLLHRRFPDQIFGIEYLINLRFLVIDDLPRWIDKLLNLEYIRLKLQESAVLLPPSIVKLKKLRYLWARSVEYSEAWNISYQTNNLEYLSGVTIKKLGDEELLKCSPNLRKLKCKYNAYLTMGKIAYPHYDLRFVTQLHSLSLDGHLSKGDFGFPSNIRKLKLYETGFPWEKMSIVGRLEFLEILKIRFGVGKRWDTRDGEFQKLRFLQLQYTNISEWNVASNEHFPKLQQLILIYCHNLEEIPSEIGEITTLELIKVKLGCLSSLVV